MVPASHGCPFLTGNRHNRQNYLVRFAHPDYAH